MKGEKLMTKMFVNLPVKDVTRTRAFFGALGFSFNPQFSNDSALCMVISEENYAMLLSEDFFKTFTSREICDTAKSVEVLIALSQDSREAVDALLGKALANGASEYSDPKDYGFMYQRAFQDLDGHAWEIFHMDMNALPEAMAAEASA
jgi:uncharacterized protein